MCSQCNSTKPLRLCLTCQKSQNWKDVNMQSHALCEGCAEQGMRRTAGEGHVHHCDSTSIREKLEGTPDIECRRCSTITNNPYLCSTCFHISTDHINVDTFSLCADCILDHHSGHETSKATENYSIRISTVPIVEKVLLGKLSSTEKEDEKKCKVRQLRMSITGKEVIYRASTHYPLWTEEDCTDPKLLGRPKIPKDYVQNVLSSLEQQFDFIQKMTEPCPCVAVWENVKRLNIFDAHGSPPHFLAMVNTPDLEKVLDRCPLELEENRELKEQLMEVIERGEVLTEPHEKIFRYYDLQTF
ncbi:hypothetical protein CAEBREN_14937 [Caenorhabditis brenneri]|uniref:Uncharacterized protein n=1 Tax=Caenorhabditis brenneri TaxID=135651 RepID=G0MMW6_CAEBE|nr:hypothetical protein CAEBREN_14937 [Caenorhabditis brenneri]